MAARSKGDVARAQAAFFAAHAELERTVSEQPGYAPALCVLGLIDAALGRKNEAIREGRRAIELLPITKDSIDGAELMKYMGVIYAWCGEKDLAIEQIEATLKIPSTLSYGNLKLHPNWDPLRGDPRLEKIVADLAPQNPEK
jgi:serine/threonine-protein kinase